MASFALSFCLLFGLSNSFNTGFSNISTTVGNKLNSVNTTIRNSMNNVVNTMRSAVSTLQSVWNNMYFATKTPYLKMPHITAYGSFDMSAKPPRVPEFSVSYWATGGIAERSTLLNGMNIVGEAGAEGILPLQGPNGDYWMNKVADNIANRLLSNNNSNNRIIVIKFRWINRL